MKSYLGLIPKYFSLNKRRMVFTIVGIVLSIMLLTALSIMVDGNSAGNVDRIKKDFGFYHVVIHNLNKEQRDSILKKENIEKLGYEERKGTYNIEGQDLYINAEVLDTKAIEMFNIELTEGKLPEAENEIILDQAIAMKMKPMPTLEDRITLTGINKKYIITNSGDKGNEIYSPDVENQEKVKKEFIISGFYRCDFYALKNLGIMSPSCPKEIDNGIDSNSSYIKFKKGIIVKDEVKKLTSANIISPNNYVEYNDELLIAIGQEIDWSNLIYKLIFSLIICLATIASIYNVFYISVIERIKHYGILRSVGSSPKQVRRLVIVEGLVLCLIALLIGLFLGTLLAWELFIYMPDIISSSAKFILLPKSLLIPAILGLLTIFISTLKPALAAGRISPIEAISNTGYKLGKESVKARRWQGILNKLFGISGLMAYRNLWRNKKKFLVTVFSMCLCSVMFIVFSYLLTTIYKMGEDSYKVPMTFSINVNNGGQEKVGLREDEYKKIININGVERVEKVRFTNLVMLERNKDQVNESFKRKQHYVSDRYNLTCRLMGVDSDVIENTLLKNGNVQNVFKEGQNSVIVDNNWPANKEKTGLLKQFEIGEQITLAIWDQVNNKAKNYKVKVAGILNNSTGYWRNGSNNEIRLIFNNSDFGKMFEIEDYQKYDIYTKENADKEQIDKELVEISKTVPESRVTYYEREYKESLEQGKNIKIFYLGLIGILSLIGVFNIFNTISAALILRTREFATLKAVGMTDKQIRINVSLEGAFHGIISSIWGSIFGASIAYIFYCVINMDVGNLTWKIPWLSILIATAINVAVCLLATAAPLKKISKINIIEGIRILD